MDTRLSTVISHEGYCGLYIQVHVRYSPFPAARPQSNVHTLTQIVRTPSRAVQRRDITLLFDTPRGSLSNARTYTLHPRARTTPCDYFTLRPALKGNEFANMLIFDPLVLREFFSLSFTPAVWYILHFPVIIKFDTVKPCTVTSFETVVRFNSDNTFRIFL